MFSQVTMSTVSSNIDNNNMLDKGLTTTLHEAMKPRFITTSSSPPAQSSPNNTSTPVTTTDPENNLNKAGGEKAIYAGKPVSVLNIDHQNYTYKSPPSSNNGGGGGGSNNGTSGGSVVVITTNNTLSPEQPQQVHINVTTTPPPQDSLNNKQKSPPPTLCYSPYEAAERLWAAPYLATECSCPYTTCTARTTTSTNNMCPSATNICTPKSTKICQPPSSIICPPKSSSYKLSSLFPLLECKLCFHNECGHYCNSHPCSRMPSTDPSAPTTQLEDTVSTHVKVLKMVLSASYTLC